MINPVVITGSGPARNRLRLGDYLGRIREEYPMLRRVPAYQIRRYLRRSQVCYRTVAYPDFAQPKIMGECLYVRPHYRSLSFEQIGHLNDIHDENTPVRRVYICDAPDPWHVRAMIERGNFQFRCVCGQFCACPQTLDDDALCYRCQIREDIKKRSKQRLARRLYNDDVAMAEADLALREIKREIKARL